MTSECIFSSLVVVGSTYQEKDVAFIIHTEKDIVLLYDLIIFSLLSEQVKLNGLYCQTTNSKLKYITFKYYICSQSTTIFHQVSTLLMHIEGYLLRD